MQCTYTLCNASRHRPGHENDAVLAKAARRKTIDNTDDAGLHCLIDGKPTTLEVDTIILCAGQEPLRDVYDAFEGGSENVSLVGGAYEAAELDAKRAINQAAKLAAIV